MAQYASRLSLPSASGTITDNPLTNSATTVNSAAFSSLPVITSGQGYLPIVLDPLGLVGVPEIAWMTAHSSGATSATIARGKENGSAGRQHAAGTKWAHGPLPRDKPGLFSNSTSATVANTTTQATLQSIIIPANTIGVGDRFKGTAHLQVDYAAGTCNATLAMYLGGSAIAAGNLTLGSSLSAQVLLTVEGLCTVIGSSGVILGTWESRGTQTGWNQFDQWINNGFFDNTSALTFDVKGQWGTAVAGTIITSIWSSVEIQKA